MHSAPMQSVSDIIKTTGGVTKIACELGVPVATVSSWGLRNQVPATRVLDFERITGVPRHEIRPDIYPSPQSDEAA